MLSSIPSRPWCSVVALLILPWLTMAAEEDNPLRISLYAESSSFDQRTNTIIFHGLQITQGDLAIHADEAVTSGVNFERSEWHFSGHVKITVDSTSIEADSADIIFEDHSLLVAELRGNPAVFQDLTATREQPIRGGANHLSYNNVDRTLRMTEGAWLSEGPNKFTGCDLIYDLEREQITSGSSECGEPVVITILPPANGPEPDSPPPR